MTVAVLAAVVISSITGVFGRGGEQAYAAERKAIHLAVVLFFYDGHASDTSPVGDAWDSSKNPIAGHYHPTSTGSRPGKSIDEILAIASAVGKTYNFPTEAIWMGLLHNLPSPTSAHDKDGAAPLIGEGGPYLYELPKSASSNNYSTATGSYTWVIAKDGVVYGVYWDGSAWQEGYSGTYP